MNDMMSLVNQIIVNALIISEGETNNGWENAIYATQFIWRLCMIVLFMGNGLAFTLLPENIKIEALLNQTVFSNTKQ